MTKLIEAPEHHKELSAPRKKAASEDDVGMSKSAGQSISSGNYKPFSATRSNASAERAAEIEKYRQILSGGKHHFNEIEN